MIYIISSKNAAALERGLEQNSKKPWAELLPQLPKGYKPEKNDQVYIDISGFKPVDLKKIFGQLKKSGAFRGIIDPKGSAADPASFFFDGAIDYIGPDLIKKGLNKKRFAMPLSWAVGKTESSGPAYNANAADDNSEPKRKKQKLPAGKFAGWKSIRSGSTGSFFFIFVSLAGKTSFRSMFGQADFTALKNRLRDVLRQYFDEADAILWMETEENNLLLVPPRADNGKAAVEAAMKMILNTRLIEIEKLDLSMPVELTIAIHYGQTVYQAPGKTGGIISEPVNYIFHLGTKKAEPGRLTISGDVPDEAIPKGLLDLFIPAGAFEGIPVLQSKRFIYR